MANIIINTLFIGFLHGVQASKHSDNIKIIESLKIIDRDCKLLKEKINNVENFGTNFLYGCINDLRKRLDKMEIGDDIISRKINNAVEEIGNGQQDLNEDIINLINTNFNNITNIIKKEFSNLFNSFENGKPITQLNENNNHDKKNTKKSNTSIKKGRNSEITDGKKYCNCPRTRNRGNCKTIIYTYEKSCSKHKKHFIQEPITEKVQIVIVNEKENTITYENKIYQKQHIKTPITIDNNYDENDKNTYINNWMNTFENNQNELLNPNNLNSCNNKFKIEII